MATVKKLKEWLNRFPDDTIVQVGVQESPSGYESWGPLTFVEMKLEDSDYGEGWEFTDYSKETFKDLKCYGQKILFLGEKG